MSRTSIRTMLLLAYIQTRTRNSQNTKQLTTRSTHTHTNCVYVYTQMDTLLETCITLSLLLSSYKVYLVHYDDKLLQVFMPRGRGLFRSILQSGVGSSYSYYSVV